MSFIARITRKPVNKKKMKEFRVSVGLAWMEIRSKAETLCKEESGSQRDRDGKVKIHFNFENLHINQTEVWEMRKQLAVATGLLVVDISDCLLIPAIEDILADAKKAYNLEFTIDSKGFLVFQQA